MVRVLVRPCVAALSALSRNSALKTALLRASAQQNEPSLLLFASSRAAPSSSPVAVRHFSSKKDKKGLDKPSLHDKFDEEPDITEIPPEVQYLSTEELKAVEDDDSEYDEDDFVVEDLDVEEYEEEEDDDDDDDDEMSAEEWAENFEREVADWDQEDDDSDVKELEDDRLYIEMPGYDTSLSLAEGGDVETEKEGPDPFSGWDQGDAVTPEMLNWMLPAEKRRPFSKGKDKPWKYFVNANHPDVVELALDVELLRLFISPNGRIRPRRFTGLTAKQQRKLAQAVKISRQMALLPYLSRYPDPSPEQWKAMEEEDIAKMMAEIANNDGKDEVVDDDDDDNFDEDMEYD